jgi:hypothetical protein
LFFFSGFRGVLAVFDEHTRPRVRQAAADEVYVRDPVLMMVEPDSLCWVTGRRTDAATGGPGPTSSGGCRRWSS